VGKHNEKMQTRAMWNGNGGMAVAQNTASEDKVDAVLANAEAARARILKRVAEHFE